MEQHQRLELAPSAPEAVKSAWAHAQVSPNPVALLITLTASSASALAVGVARGWSTAFNHPVELITFCLVAVALQFVAVEIYDRGAISFGGTGLLALGFAVGPAAAMAAAVVTAAVRLLASRGRLYRGIFDAAQLAVAAGVATLLFQVIPASATMAQLAAAVVAGAIFLVVNIGLVSTAMGLEERVPVRVIWRERFRWMTPYGLAAGPLAFALVAGYERFGALAVLVFAIPPASMMFSVRQYVTRTHESVAELREKNTQLLTLADEVRRTHRNLIAALSRSMEAKDLYTGGHTERVSEIAVALARRLGYDGEDLDAIEIGALLHDIGKIGVPERILHKPGPLDETEWEIMRRHPIVSEFILSGIELHPFVMQIARSSHERIDGKGYPDGRSGDEIPLPARIVLVADAFDALTSDRPYRPKRAPHQALAEIHANTGTQFCPSVVEALDRLAREDSSVLGTIPIWAVNVA
jgi:putative nucleotidyltransferase with HDIG domain